ncbi:uncharacterized protein LOC131885747 isoform X2 [Tigriopus californicus]|uniref:uncharacterized protein LOC131885747 isoform X2 n=1 Tax=Tigriopus californicus TaxID=6832 RepID=UPI0027DAB07F|nr:uncharacterized protein LOC131885747 isoform X2 [Tigriopus californicus]
MQILQLPAVDPIECRFKTNRLKIKLNWKANSNEGEVIDPSGNDGTSSSTSASSSWRSLEEFQLKFLEGNGIRAKGANIDYSDELSSGTVLNVKSQRLPNPNEDDNEDPEEEDDDDKGRSLGDFSWSVPTSVCYQSILKIKSRAPKSFGQPGDRVEYAITENLESSREGRANETKVVLNGLLTIGGQDSDENMDDENDDDDVEEGVEEEVANEAGEIDENINKNGTKARQGKGGSKETKKKTKKDKGKKQGKIKVKNERILVHIPIKELDPGASYKLNLRGLSKNISTTNVTTLLDASMNDIFQTVFTVASADQSHIVNVLVAGRVFPDRQIILRAMLKDCSKFQRKRSGSDGTDDPSTALSSERWKFFWSTDGKINFNLANQDLQKLRIPKHSLEGGREYIFFVEVIPELNPEASFQNQLSFTVQSLGLKAQFAASELTFGIQNEITLDGSLSRDLDNRSGNLTFDWFCLDELTNQPCYALDVEASNNQSTTSPMLLKEKFKESMSRQLVRLPGLSLAIGRYNFQLCITKDSRSNCAKMVVEIKPGKVATIQLAARDSVTNPEEETVIKALVTGSQGTCVHWECVLAEGFAFIDLSEHTKSAQVVCFTGTSSQRGFHLVIPGGVLEGKTRYKFRLVARNPLLGISDASTVITTLEPPNEGTCEIEPKEGVALNTTFVLDCHSFKNADGLIFTVEYADKASLSPNNFVHLDEFLGSDASELQFLASPGKIQILVTICTFQEVCDQLLLDDIIQVDKAQIDDGTIRSLGIAVANEISQKEPLRALSLMRRIVLSIPEADEDVWNQYKVPVCSLQFGTFREATAEFTQDLVPSDVPIAVTMLDLFLKSPCWNVKDETIADERRNALWAGKQLSDALGTLQKKLQSLQEDPSLKEKLRRKRAFSSTAKFQVLPRLTSKLARLKRSDGNLEQSEGQHNILTFFDSIISPEQMEVVLQFAEMSIGGDIQSEIQSMKELLDQIHTDSMKNLCRGTTPQSDARMIMTDTLEISMKRTEFIEGDKEKFAFGLSSSQVNLDDSAIQKFSEWNCHSNKEADSNQAPCIGLCIGTALYEEDYVTPTSQKFNLTRPPMRSDIHDIRLLNPQSGKDLTEQYQNEDLGGSLQIEIEVNEDAQDPGSSRPKRSTNPSISTGYELTCMVFQNDNWTSEFCETKEFVTKADGTATVNCDCSVPGYVAVFLVSSGSGEDVTLKVNEVRVFDETITITFLEAYYEVVGPNEEDKAHFITTIRTQMANLLTTDVSNIQDVEVWEGSTVVKMQIVGYDEQESAELEKAYMELAQKFERGEVKMTDQKGRPLTLQPQCVMDSCRVRDKESETKIFYIIAGVAVAIILFVIILIIVGVVLKNKKRTEKVKPFMNSGSQPPTYRTFQFADSLEGTKVNYGGTRKPVPAPYLPSNSNYSDMQRDQILEEESKSVDSGILIDREHGDVPNNPARYKKPSKEDLAKTQPISEDIRVERRMTEKLPGTPE